MNFALFLLLPLSISTIIFSAVNCNFHLDRTKTSKLVHLLLARNLTLHFDIRQQTIANKASNLFRVHDWDDGVLFHLSISTLPNKIILAFRIRNGQPKSFQISTPFLLGDNQFHKILVVVAGNQLTIAQNCHRLLWIDDFEMDLIRDGKNGGQISDEWNITLGDDGALQMRSFTSDMGRPLNSLCPHLEVLTDNRVEIEYGRPETESARSLWHGTRIKKEQNVEERIANLEEKMAEWDKNWMKMEGRVKRVESHQRGCKMDGKWYSPGNKIQNRAQCQECHCGLDGRVHCGQIGCPRLECAHPVHIHGQCCPECGKRCLYNGQSYESGDSFWPKQCVRCHCNNGRMNCEFRNVAHCARLDCPRQETLPNQCCPVCVDVDHCANGQNLCDANAFCVSGRHSPNCHCKPGFFGNGTKCYDVDECLWDENARAQLGGCGDGALCINVPGSFRCDCLPGYQKLDERNCVDLIRI